MLLQFRKTPCPCLGRATREVQNTELTQEVRLSDGMPDIGRVIASYAQVILRGKEWRANEVSASGGVMVWALYLPEDGSGPRSVDTWIPFQMKWELPQSDRDGPLRILPLLRYVDSRTISARKMMIRAGVAAMAEALRPAEAETYTADALPEDVQLLRRTYPLRLLREAGEKTFQLDEELAMPAPAPEAERILACTLSPEVTDQKVLSNKVACRGTVKLHLLYRCREGMLHAQNFELPFSQLADLEGEYTPEARAEIQMAVTSLEPELSESGQLRIKAGIVGQYLVTDVVHSELIEDAYSPRRTVEMERAEMDVPAELESRCDAMSAQQLLTGQGGKVKDVYFLPDFPRVHQTRDGVTLETPGLFQVLSEDESGVLQAGTVRWEGTLALPAAADVRVISIPQSAGEPQTSVDAEGISVSVPLELRTETAAGSGVSMLSGLELGEPQEPNRDRPSLILCRAGGESLWEIAKRCGSTMSAIQKANALPGEPPAGKLLLIPVS